MPPIADELVTALAAQGWDASAIAALWLVFGPTLRSVGLVTGERVEESTRNLLRIGTKAKRWIPEGDAEQVHPRVSQRVLQEGAWLDDDVAQSYMAGLLVAGRSADGGDDEATYYAGIVGRMSARQVRLHHLLYSAYRGWPDQSRNVGEYQDRIAMRVAFRFSDLAPHFPGVDIRAAVGNGLIALDQQGLVDTYTTGTLSPHAVEAGITDGVELTPSPLGAQLYLYAYGVKNEHPSSIIRLLDSRQFDPPGPTAPFVRLP